jgi:hypothetical protein
MTRRETRRDRRTMSSHIIHNLRRERDTERQGKKDGDRSHHFLSLPFLSLSLYCCLVVVSADNCLYLSTLQRRTSIDLFCPFATVIWQLTLVTRTCSGRRQHSHQADHRGVHLSASAGVIATDHYSSGTRANAVYHTSKSRDRSTEKRNRQRREMLVDWRAVCVEHVA